MSEVKKEVIDLEFLRSVIENDREFEKELFAIFTENAHSNILRMTKAIEEPAKNDWYMSAHAFKGAAASIGAFRLSEMLEYAQKHPDEEADKKKVILQKIKDEFVLVLEFIKGEMVG